MAENIWNFSIENYNSLPTLNEAHAALAARRLAFERFLDSARDIVASYEMGDGRVAAFLLHRHWELQPGALMVEFPATLRSGRKALVTRAVHADTSSTSIWPARWSCSRTNPYVNALEFSTDPAVGSVYAEMIGHHDIIREITRLVFENEVEDLFGFAICSRFGLLFSDHQQLVEENFDEMSVVTAQTLTKEERKTVLQTGWPLLNRSPVAGCKAYCVHGPEQSCQHHTQIPDPPVCQPSGCA